MRKILAGLLIALSILAGRAGAQTVVPDRAFIANASSTGTTNAHLTKLTGAPSTAVISATTDTSGVIGITIGNGGTTGKAIIQTRGIVSCAFDAATTAGDFVSISSSTAGDCHDAGLSYPTSGQVLGQVLATIGSAGSASMYFYGAGIGAVVSDPSVRIVGSESGADTGAQLNNCFANLPNNQGTCVLSGNLKPLGAPEISTALVWLGPAMISGCGQTILQDVGIAPSVLGASVVGCPGRTLVFQKNANIDQITCSNVCLVQGITLVGQGGSFTGKGIEINSTGVAQFNTLSDEAGAAIDVQGGGVAQFNTVSSVSAGHAVTVGSSSHAVFNTSLTANASDVVYAYGNSADIRGNIINLSPNASTSGLCGINFNGDQIGGRSFGNWIFIADSTNTGNVDKGICDTPTGTHNLDMLFEGDHVTGVFSGSVTSYAFSVNNAAGLNTNWGVTFRDEGAVHVGAPVTSGAFIQDVDANNNAVTWEDLELGDSAALTDGTTTGTNNILIAHNWNSTSFSALVSPSILGNGSQYYCGNCNRQGITGGSGVELFKVGGYLTGIPILQWSYVNGTNQAASATSVSKALGFHQNQGDTIIVAGQCTATAMPTITVSDAANGTYTQDFAPVSDGANHWIFLHRFSNVFGSASGANTVTIASSGTTCSYVNLAAAADYSGGVLTPDGTGTSATGTSTTAATGALAVHQNDLVVGVLSSPAGLISPSTGCLQQCRPGTGDFLTVFEDVIGPVSGSQNMQANVVSSDPWVALAFAYKFQ